MHRVHLGHTIHSIVDIHTTPHNMHRIGGVGIHHIHSLRASHTTTTDSPPSHIRRHVVVNALIAAIRQPASRH